MSTFTQSPSGSQSEKVQEILVELEQKGADLRSRIESSAHLTSSEMDTHEFLSYEDKIDSIFKMCKEHGQNMSKLTTDVNILKTDITKATMTPNEKLSFKHHIASSQGKIMRLEKKNENLSQKIIDLQESQYSNNLVFFNVEEQGSQAPINLRDTIYGLIGDMEIPNELIFSKEIPSGEIRISDVYRQGRFQREKPRPIVVKFLTKIGRDIVYSKIYRDKLKEVHKDIRIADHFTPETREKRSALIDTMKDIRDDKAYAGKKVVMAKDKILIEGKPLKDEVFEKHPLPDFSPLTTDYFSMKHTDELCYKDSFFQGHKISASNRFQAAAARNAIFSIPYLATAQHVMYAYKFTSPDNKKIFTGYSDDGEYTSGGIIMDMIEESKKDNICVCVTRKKLGHNIGQARFELIVQAVQEVLEIPDTVKDIDSLYKDISFDNK